MDQHQWFYLAHRTNDPIGPITENDILELARQGKLQMDSRVASPSRTQNNWIEVRDIPGLVEAINQGESERIQAQNERLQQKEAQREAKRLAREQRLLEKQLLAEQRAKNEGAGSAEVEIQTATESKSDARARLPLNFQIAAWSGGLGLCLLLLAPFFVWIRFGAGGVTGLAGDGKILLVVTLLTGSGYVAAILMGRWLVPSLLVLQAWGTLATIWMAALIWRCSAIANQASETGNAFAALFASQITPGAGLYLGLIGGATVAGALGYFVAEKLRETRSTHIFFASQAGSIILGFVLTGLSNFGSLTGENEWLGKETGIAQGETSKSANAPDPAVTKEQEAAIAKYILEELELYEVTAEKVESLLDGRVPGVVFKLRNNGDRTLTRVEVTVYFKDADGNVIHEEGFVPVSESSFSGNNKPLKPGYVWQMEAGKFYAAKSVPSEWKEGNFGYAVTDIEFDTKNATDTDATNGESAAKSKYINTELELYEATAKYMESTLDGHVPGVKFKLRNKGDRTLKMVEVTVYFKDAKGNVIHEEDFHPVLISEFSVLGDNKPLKPGYVWQMESGRFYSAKSVPSEWEEGKVDFAITDIEFEED